MEVICLPTLSPEHHSTTRLPALVAPMTLRGAGILDRILYRLIMAGVDITDGEVCWPWPGSISGPGYGRIGSDPRGETYVHRVVYREVIGPVPDDHDVEHTCHSDDTACRSGGGCRHRRCANPRHLDAVPHAENMRRRRTDVRVRRCANGPHDFEPHRSGARSCRICFNAYQWAMRRGFRGSFKELWESPYAAAYTRR